MSIEQNKAIARRWMDEVWQNASLSSMDELLAPDFVFNYPMSGATSDREGYKQTVIGVHSGFPDIQFNTEDMIAEGDKVAVYWRGVGTHEREFWGVTATGKQVTTEGISILRIAGGKITEEVQYMNTLEALQQIGALPSQESEGLRTD